MSRNLSWENSEYPKESYEKEVHGLTLLIDRQVREKNVDYLIQAKVNDFKPNLKFDWSINRQVFEEECNGDFADARMDDHLADLWYKQVLDQYFEILSKVSSEELDRIFAEG